MKKVLVTTTESLQGWDIIDYIEPIYASVVLATGLFSENGITLSEYFSFYPSKHYSRNINNINQRAVDILKAKALSLGANTILGLKVDVDEISAMGQMFMITAWGTAVIAKNSNSALETNIKEFDKLEVIDQANIFRLISELKNPNFILSLTDLKFIAETQSPLFKDFLLERYLNYDSNEEMESIYNETIKLYNEYFSFLEPKLISLSLHERLLDENRNSVIDKILALIKHTDLLDYSYIEKILSLASFSKRQLALTLALNDKSSYSKDDIDSLEQVMKAIISAFPTKATITIKKNLLAHEREVWVCPCNCMNEINDDHCYDCQKDQYGFIRPELKPQTVVEILNKKLVALKALLG